MNLNFKMSELIHSDKANEHKINNIPTDKTILDNMLNLIVFVLQPLRDMAGPINVTSGYRNTLLNSLVGGSATSNHLTGCAADIIPSKITLKQAFDFITQNLDYDECFLETDQSGNKWLHVAYRKGANRKKHDANFKA